MHYTFSQYYIYVIFVAVMAAFSYLNKLNRTEVFSFFMYAIMLLFAVLRINTGADYSTYIEMHEEAGKSYFTDLFSFTEPLYFLLLKFLYFFSDDYWLMFAVVAIIIYTILFLAVKKLSIDPALSLLLYIIVAYYFISINQLRQSISLVIFLYSISSIIDKKPGKYYLLNIIGFGFHYSAVMAFLIYPIVNTSFSKKTLTIIFILSIVLSPVIEKLFVTYLGELDTLYTKYFDIEEYMEKNYLALGKVIVPNLILIYSLIKFKSFTRYEYSIFMIYFCGIVYYNIFFGKHIFIRPGMYFEIVTILYIPIFIKKFFDLVTGFIIETLIILYYAFSVTLYGILINGGQGVVPYKLIFSR